MASVTVNTFQGRPYQQPLWDYIMGGGKRAVAVWHRRAGKDTTALHLTVRKMFERVGVYYHCFPEYNQGRKVLWNGIDHAGNRFLSAFPKEVVKRRNNQEMTLELVNGSVWQIIGADNYDAIVGANPVGIVMSEWAISDKYPMAWDYFRPMLVENGGWALFIYTPRGMNHGAQLYQTALKNPSWFVQLLTVDDTKVIPQEAIQAERDAGMPESMIQQEFYCSFVASTENVLIPFDVIQAAMRRDIDPSGLPRYAGCDPARFGDDRTAVVIRQGPSIIHVETWQGYSTAQTAGKIIAMYRAGMFDVIAIDTIGIGSGVYDMVSTAGIPSVPVNVSESPAYQPERFVRLRDELWWRVREWFMDMGCSIHQTIDRHAVNALVADLQDIRYDFTATGKLQVESKDAIKKRLKFSPDIGDALCCTFAPSIESTIPLADRTHYSIKNVILSQERYDPLTFGMGDDAIRRFM